MEQLIQLNSNARLSERFALGEFTKSGSHPEVYNIPSHEAIGNLKRLCGWLEVLRERYNAEYCLSSRLSEAHGLSSRLSEAHGEISRDPSTTLGMTEGPTLGMTKGPALGMTEGPTLGMTEGPTLGMTNEEPIRINSGYRSPQLNKKIGGAPSSNHLTGCAADIRVYGME